MYFSYLLLPPVPANFFSECLKKISLIDSDPRINEINKFRGPENRATILPKIVNEWLRENIYDQIFNDPDAARNGLLNVTTYKDHWENKNWWGMHTKHVDVGRSYALNYYFDTGGSNTIIRWHDDKNIVAEVGPIRTHQWCILKTDILHSVKGIEPGKTRYFISIDINDLAYEKISIIVDNKSKI